MTKPFSFRRVAQEAARAADDRKALAIKLYDVRRFSTVADYFLVATVPSSSHASAVEDEMDRRLGPRVRRRDGSDRAAWRVLDYGGFVAHLMSESARTFFGLERLWESARIVRWEVDDRHRAAAGRRGRP